MRNERKKKTNHVLTLDISEKVTDHSKSKDSNGDTERGREKISSFLMGIKMKQPFWKACPQRLAQ